MRMPCFRQAMEQGLICRADADLLAAAYEGFCWGILCHFMESGQTDRFLEISTIVDDLFLTPLFDSASAENRKESTQS
jgi:hypothetical protein